MSHYIALCWQICVNNNTLFYIDVIYRKYSHCLIFGMNWNFFSWYFCDLWRFCFNPINTADNFIKNIKISNDDKLKQLHDLNQQIHSSWLISSNSKTLIEGALKQAIKKEFDQLFKGLDINKIIQALEQLNPGILTKHQDEFKTSVRDAIDCETKNIVEVLIGLKTTTHDKAFDHQLLNIITSKLVTKLTVYIETISVDDIQSILSSIESVHKDFKKDIITLVNSRLNILINEVKADINQTCIIYKILNDANYFEKSYNALKDRIKDNISNTINDATLSDLICNFNILENLHQNYKNIVQDKINAITTASQMLNTLKQIDEIDTTPKNKKILTNMCIKSLAKEEVRILDSEFSQIKAYIDQESISSVENLLETQKFILKKKLLYKEYGLKRSDASCDSLFKALNSEEDILSPKQFIKILNNLGENQKNIKSLYDDYIKNQALCCDLYDKMFPDLPGLDGITKSRLVIKGICFHDPDYKECIKKDYSQELLKVIELLLALTPEGEETNAKLSCCKTTLISYKDQLNSYLEEFKKVKNLMSTKGLLIDPDRVAFNDMLSVLNIQMGKYEKAAHCRHKEHGDGGDSEESNKAESLLKQILAAGPKIFKIIKEQSQEQQKETSLLFYIKLTFDKYNNLEPKKKSPDKIEILNSHNKNNSNVLVTVKEKFIAHIEPKNEMVKLALNFIKNQTKQIFNTGNEALNKKTEEVKNTCKQKIDSLQCQSKQQGYNLSSLKSVFKKDQHVINPLLEVDLDLHSDKAPESHILGEEKNDDSML